MTLEDKVGHLGYVLLLSGTTLLANQSWLGWPLCILGDLVWVWVGWRMRMSSIWVWQSAFLVVGLVGWWRWTH